MSVIMTFRASGDPQRLEQLAAQDPQRMRSIADRAREHGLIAHRFYGSEADGEIMVVDEWPDQETFQGFFASVRSEIESMMAEAGVSGEPDVRFWRKLESHDEVGWES